MLSLQAAEAAAAVANGGPGGSNHSGGTGGKAGVGGGLYRTGANGGRPDPLCMSNASLHALQNLQPWADDEYDLGDYGIDIPSLGTHGDDLAGGMQTRHERMSDRSPSSCGSESSDGSESPGPVIGRSSSTSSLAPVVRGGSSATSRPQSPPGSATCTPVVVHQPRPTYCSGSSSLLPV